MPNPKPVAQSTLDASSPTLAKKKPGRPKKGTGPVHVVNTIAVDTLLTDQQVSNEIGVTPATLRKWRHNRTFPQPITLPGGHKRTRTSDFNAWAAAQVGDADTDAERRRDLMAGVRSHQTRGPRPIHQRHRRPGTPWA